MNKLPKSYQSSTPYYQLFFYSVFLAILMAAFVPVAGASPCSDFLNDRGWNRHGQLKNDIIDSNNLAKDLKKIPSLQLQSLFVMLENNVLKAVGEISITPVGESSMDAVISLKMSDIIVQNFRFVGHSLHSQEHGVVYHFTHKNVHVAYIPKSMQVILSSADWIDPRVLRLNIPNDSVPTNDATPRFRDLGPI